MSIYIKYLKQNNFGEMVYAAHTQQNSGKKQRFILSLFLNSNLNLLSYLLITPIPISRSSSSEGSFGAAFFGRG
jgi:hypothetical protein